MKYTEEQQKQIKAQEFDYAMLSRCQSDCEYYLNWGNRSERVLHQGSVEKQILYMKELWNKLTIKPEWISFEKIQEYENKMK